MTVKKETTMAAFFLFRHSGLCVIWLTLCLSDIVAFAGNNETRNGSLPVAFNDQAADEDESKMGCIDWEGKPVKDGEKYTPNKNDMCMRCTCDHRFPIICHSVACSPPLDCLNVKLVSGACCEYECLDGNGKNVSDSGKNPSDKTESITNLSLRLIASTVTSLLFLALLLFMVHRLRQRRMLMALRRFQARSEVCISDDMDDDRNIPDNFLSLECPPYTDPPPPYSPPKPPHILPGEQPPAYDEISIAENGNRGDSRSGSGSQEERNNTQHETQLAREIILSNNCPVRAELQNEMNQSNSLHQMYSSSQHPSFNVEMEMPRQPVVQSQDTANTLNQNEDILPAYASTDIVFRNATFSTMVTPPHRPTTDSIDTTTATPTHLSNSNVRDGETRGADGEGHATTGMPTLTAFQRFSSLFKRDKSKYKNRSGSNTQQRRQRPMSEFVPPHYATLSRTTPHNQNNFDDDQPGSNNINNAYTNSHVTYRHNNGSRHHGESRVRSCYPNLSLTDRMRLSYDSARAAYELAALSPSTSSNSSLSMEQIPVQDASTAITASCVPSTTTYSTNMGASPLQQSTTHNYRECIHDLQQQHQQQLQQQQQQNNAVESHHSISESLPNNCSSTHSPPDGDYSHTNRFCHPQLNSISDSTRRSPERDASSSFYNNSGSNLPSGQTYLDDNRRYPETEDNNREYCNRRNGDGASRKSNNGHRSAALPSHETSNHESQPIVEALSINSGALPPSPLPSLGQMRRSHSSTSQVSAFSVCSETGEKKLKDDKHESATSVKPLASDCQYPPHHHHSLSQAYNKLHKNAPHSNHKPMLRANPNPPPPPPPPLPTQPVKRSSDYIPVTPLLDPDLHPATLVVPMSGLHSFTGSSNNNGSTSQSKKFRQEDLSVDLQACGNEDNISVTAIQSSPISPPFVTVQSGKLISHPPSSTVDWSVIGDAKNPMDKLCLENNNNNDENRIRIRKKKDKDRRSSGLSVKPKDIPTSPTHFSKGDERIKHDIGNLKKHSRLNSAKGMSGSRRADKKKLQNFQVSTSTLDEDSQPNHEVCSSLPYGNADVYRGQVCDASPSASSFSVLSSPFHKYIENNPDAVQLSKDSGQQDSKRYHNLSSSKAQPPPDFGATAYPSTNTNTINPSSSSPSSRHLHQPSLGTVKYPSPQSRKKPGHKRQTASSSGNRNFVNGHGPSSGTPSQKHTRSKSLTTDKHQQHQLENDPVSNDTAFDQVISGGKWVKSGFGHDMGFDDQLGGMDRTSGDHLQFNSNPHPHSSKLNRAEGYNNTYKNYDFVAQPAHGPEPKIATSAAVVPLPSRRRSGLSQDLSFVNRSEINPSTSKRMNKRGSLPGFLTFATGSQQPSQQKGFCDPLDYNMDEDYSCHQETTELPQKQMKNSRERRDRSNSHDKSGRLTATSYV